MDCQHIAAIVTILSCVVATFKWGKSLLVKLCHFVYRYKPEVPRDTIRVLPKIHSCFWSNGSVCGKPAMHVVGRWNVTNITGNQVLLLAAKTSKPKTDVNVLTRHPNNNVFGQFPILPGETTEVIFDFWVLPPVCKEGKDFTTSVILVDQYGNNHKIKNVVFKGTKLKEPQNDEPPSESIHSITDPIEKDIVAVLKAEVNRYKVCGRRVGGLGSIQTTIQGRSYKGVGTEWRAVHSPKNQEIIEDESTIDISSDNAQALVNIYGRLRTDYERECFFRALFLRLDRSKEYAPIGYLILYVSFMLNKLEVALNEAVKNLQGDKAYGFSDLLRLLDALLRFRHSSFSIEKLDFIEQALVNLREHTFRINERIAAVRAYRLSHSG